MFAESITTEHLELRLPRLEDATEIFSRYASNPAVTRNLSWPTHTSPADTRRFLQVAEQMRADGTLVNWAICTRNDGRLHGMIGVRPDLPRVEIGYVLAQDRWGRGWMTEALRAVVAELQKHPEVWRIHAHCATDNLASARVLEKAGFEFEGVARRYLVLPNRGPEPIDVKRYALIVR